MSIMSVPVIADAAAWCFAAVSAFAPTPIRRLPEIGRDSATVRVPTRHGEVRCTLYRPLEPAEAKPPLYVNAHGGGFVIRYPQQDDPLCRFLAAKAGVYVLNVDYDVAPRHRFPVPVEQLFDVVRWAADGERPWDGTRLCIGGQSAGGSLATGTCRLALENGGPAIALQVLHYAALDLATPARERRSSADRPVLPVWMAEMFKTAYTPDPRQRRDRLASPAWGSNDDGLEGIAPALIITAEKDGLRQGGARYARKLEAVGSLAEYREVPGADHGYDIVGNDEALTRSSYEAIAGHVRRATTPGAPRPARPGDAPR